MYSLYDDEKRFFSSLGKILTNLQAPELHKS